MNGQLTLITTNKQYKKYSYKYSATTYNGVHVFATKTEQSIAPAIYATKKVLSEMYPADITDANGVIARTNACMYERKTSNFYGFFYQGANRSLYVNGTEYTSVSAIPTNSIMFTDPKYWPCFCVKTDGTATIRWFGSRTDLSVALPYCRCIIGACHPLVFNSKCVFNEDVYDAEPSNSRLVHSPLSDPRPSRYNHNINTTNAIRTLLGHKPDGAFLMVCVDDTISMKAAANMMQDLGCDYAVNMDGGGPSQMHLNENYGPKGTVTKNAGEYIHTAVCAYIK